LSSNGNDRRNGRDNRFHLAAANDEIILDALRHTCANKASCSRASLCKSRPRATLLLRLRSNETKFTISGRLIPEQSLNADDITLRLPKFVVRKNFACYFYS
jgi:hypothetical protein